MFTIDESLKNSYTRLHPAPVRHWRLNCDGDIMLSRVKGSIAGKVQSLKKGKGSKASAAELADDGSAAAPSPSAPRQNRVIRKARVPDEERVTALPKSFFDAEFDPCLYVLQASLLFVFPYIDLVRPSNP